MDTNELADLFRHLINDRPGSFATKIVTALSRKEVVLPLAFEVRARLFTYTVNVAFDRSRRCTVVSAAVSDRYMLAEPGPLVEWPGLPAGWSGLVAFKAADVIDRAFRGHGERFDSRLP